MVIREVEIGRPSWPEAWAAVREYAERELSVAGGTSFSVEPTGTDEAPSYRLRFHRGPQPTLADLP